MAQMRVERAVAKKEYDWQLLRELDKKNPDYSIESLTRLGKESLSMLVSGGYVQVNSDTVVVTIQGLQELMKRYTFSYAQDLMLYREQSEVLNANR